MKSTKRTTFLFDKKAHIMMYKPIFVSMAEDIKNTHKNRIRVMKFQSSSLATAIGMNKYERISKEFERLWKATSLQSFTSAFLKASTKDIQTSIDVAIATTPGAFERVKEAKQMGEKSMCSVAVTHNKVEALKTMEEETNNLKVKQEALKQEGADTKEIEAKIQACGLVKAEITKSVNTNYGTHRENDGIVQYEQQEGVTVLRENRACWKLKEVTPKISLIGRVDGLIDDDCVLEVKNRTRKRNLSDSISPLENVQVQSYLFLFDRPRAVLLQCFREAGNNTLKAIQVEKDEVFWNTVVKRMQACADILEEVFEDEVKAKLYANMSTEEREAFLVERIVSNTR